MNSLERALQPRDLSNYTDKPAPAINQPAPPLPPITPVRRVPVSPNANAQANRLIANSQNQAEYAVKRLLTKPKALAPSATIQVAQTTVSNSGIVPVLNTLTATDGLNVYGPIYPLIAPPSASTFSTLNPGTTHVSDAFGGLFISNITLNSQITGLITNVTSGSAFTLTIAQILDYRPSGQAFAGILIRSNTAPTNFRYLLFHDGTTAAGAYTIAGDYYVPGFTIGVNQFSQSSIPASGLRFLRLAYNGSNVTCSTSNNGFDFSNVVGSFFAPGTMGPIDGVGIAVAGSGTAMTSLILSYQLS